MPAHGIAFHHFHDGQLGGPNVIYPAGRGSLSAQQLAELIAQIDPRRILPAHAFLSRAVRGRLSGNEICLTFDDTLRCQYDLAVPVLEDFGLTAFWFVNSSVLQGNIERFEVYRQFRTTGFASADDFYASFFVNLSESDFGDEAEEAIASYRPDMRSACYPFYTTSDLQFRYVRDHVLGPTRYAAVMDRMMDEAGFDVRRVARQLWMDDSAVLSLHESGHVIGMHSHTHPGDLASMEPDEQRYEYRANFSHLTALLGEPPATMAHPCNSYDADTLRLLEGLNIRLGFRSDFSARAAGPLEMPRTDPIRLAQRIAA
ncbi:MAG: polysaccharide deacetylase family protein [Phycisphaerae bacterium]|nr:polysaccharide deacetylase family protein [Phycisphaerae bacterium]